MPRAVLAVARRPPAALRDDFPALPDDDTAGWNLPHARERAPRGPHPPQGEDVVDPLEVDPGRDLSGREERFGLRAEREGSVGQQRVVKGAHPEPVPHQRHPSFPRLPPGKRELAVEAVEGGEAVALQEPMDDLGVARGLELLAVRAQLFAELRVVVDLAVVDERAAVGCAHLRLPAAGKVEDREPGRDEPGPFVEQEPEPVRPAMAQGARHPQQRVFRDRRLSARSHDPREAAHQSGRSGNTAGACRYSVAVRRRSISPKAISTSAGSRPVMGARSSGFIPSPWPHRSRSIVSCG